MRLAPGGREYAYWRLEATPADIAMEVSFDEGSTWHNLLSEEASQGSVVSILVAGPSATGNPDGTVVLSLGKNTAQIRAVDNPEIVLRSAGSIYVRDL